LIHVLDINVGLKVETDITGSIAASPILVDISAERFKHFFSSLLKTLFHWLFHWGYCYHLCYIYFYV